MKRNLVVTALFSVLVAGVVLAYAAFAPGRVQPAMGQMAFGQTGQAGAGTPAVTGYLDGQEIEFIHTEASDRQVAQVLSAMVGAQVLYVPSLADAPAAMRANVYVFTNGVKDGGPLGFQPDVFDAPPHTAGYSPLRTLHLVTWQPGHHSHLLTSAQQIQDAAAAGEVTIQTTSVVINMPILTWPGGQR